MALELITIDSDVLYDSIIQAMEIACGEALYPGDERRIFVEGLVQVIVGVANACNTACNNKMLAYASGDALDALGTRLGVERLEASAATATFQFALSEAQAADVTIPSGTRVTANGDLYFASVADLVIPTGDTMGTVECECTVAGSVGNGYAPGSIAQIVDLVAYVQSAVNTTETAGGVDTEKDDALRERIILSNSKFSTAGPKNAYIYWAKSADPSIIDVAVTSPSDGVVSIYPLCAGGQLPGETLLQKVEDVVSADDVRPMTDYVQVLSPTAVPYDIEIEYYTTEADEAACQETIEGASGAIAQYVAWQCGALGRDINPDKLRALCLAPSDGTGCIRIDVTSPARTELDEDEVAQVGTITITHLVATE